MNRLLTSVILMLFMVPGITQELYIFTDPASNVPAHSLGIRANTMVMPMEGQGRSAIRFSPDVMWGVTKNWMVKLSGYGSDMFQPAFRPEGASLYTKYRFLSNDDFHSHFRMAALAKVAVNLNPFQMDREVRHWWPDGNGGFYEHIDIEKHGADEQVLEGNHSGWKLGLVATQLQHKLAVSAGASVIGRMNNPGYRMVAGDSRSAFEGTLSAGYLLFPRDYESYGQTNLNLYVEFLGQRALDKPAWFVDAAPAVQLIFNSVARMDLAYRFQLGGTMRRFNEQQWLLRFEYNWLQAMKRG